MLHAIHKFTRVRPFWLIQSTSAFKLPVFIKGSLVKILLFPSFPFQKAFYLLVLSIPAFKSVAYASFCSLTIEAIIDEGTNETVGAGMIL